MATNAIQTFKDKYPQWRDYDLWLNPNGDDFDVMYGNVRIGYVVVLVGFPLEAICTEDPK